MYEKFSVKYVRDWKCAYRVLLGESGGQRHSDGREGGGGGGQAS